MCKYVKKGLQSIVPAKQKCACFSSGGPSEDIFFSQLKHLRYTVCKMKQKLKRWCSSWRITKNLLIRNWLEMKWRHKKSRCLNRHSCPLYNFWHVVPQWLNDLKHNRGKFSKKSPFDFNANLCVEINLYLIHL